MKGTETRAQSWLIKQLPRPTVFLNTRLEVVHASDSWMRAFEFEGRPVVGTSILDLFPDASVEWVDVLKACLKGHSGHTGTERFVDAAHSEFWFEWINTPWYDEHENIAGVLIQVFDVTQRIRREVEFEKAQALLEAKATNARIGSWEYNAFTGELIWSDMTREIHEVPEDFVPDMDTAIKFYEEGYSRNTISMAVYRAMETGRPWKEKLRLITYTGKELWVIAAGRPIYKDGIYVGLIGTFQDVTEVNISHQRTTETENLLRTVVDNLPLNVYIKDLESRKLLVNKAECEYLGAGHPDELLGKSDFDLYAAPVAERSREEDLQVMNNGVPIIGRETLSVRKDGRTTHFLTSKIPLQDEDGQVYGLLGLSMDISDLKQKEGELRELINVSSQQNKKLVNFAHIVSHNLRSHSANFSMLLDLLAREQDEGEKERIIGMLNDASENLMETLDNLNEVIAINTNVKLERREIHLHRAVRTVGRNLSAFLKTHRAKLVNRIPGDAVLRGIPAYMESILMNFITNSVRYRHPDRDPEVQISWESKGGRPVLIISDNGLGIDLKKNGDKLFGMYKTFHEHPDARGIGLYITKNQVEAMNGHIITCSEVGRGTTFRIYFDEKG